MPAKRRAHSIPHVGGPGAGVKYRLTRSNIPNFGTTTTLDPKQRKSIWFCFPSDQRTEYYSRRPCSEYESWIRITGTCPQNIVQRRMGIF